MGLRFRLHRRELPGNPDLVFPRHDAVIFVHGCFWHGHGCKRGGSGPKSNQPYWTPKIERTRARDSSAKQALESMGWRVLTLWECELRDVNAIRDRIASFFGS
jgi:DNA mismatch endonuclease (patch repair protein)